MVRRCDILLMLWFLCVSLLCRPANAEEPVSAQPNASGLLSEGINRFYYDDGRLKREVTYANGRGNGPYKQYFPTGELQEEGQYVDGEKAGIIKVHFKEGPVRFEERYVHGRKAYLKEFNLSGKLLQEYSFEGKIRGR